MNLHEYQAKEILSSHGVRIQRGQIIEKVDEVSSATQKLINETGTSFFVIKAQVHAGGRGKEGALN